MAENLTVAHGGGGVSHRGAPRELLVRDEDLHGDR